MRCCASRRFAAAIVAGRPYPDLDAVDAAVGAQFARLEWPDLAEALDGHPRIGDRSASGWSRAEQAGTAGMDLALARDLADANHGYEQRFGHVFLICASGLSAEQMLASLRARLEHDPARERQVVAAELRKITELRMRKLLAG